MSGPDTAGMREARSGSTSETCMKGAGVQVSALAAYLQQRFAPPGPFGFATRDWRIEAEQILALPVVQRLAVEKAAEELRAAAQWLREASLSDVPGPPAVWQHLDVRADALAAAAQPTDGRAGA